MNFGVWGGGSNILWVFHTLAVDYQMQKVSGPIATEVTAILLC